MEKGSSDDYDYSDSFINDSDPSRHDDDESMPFSLVLLFSTVSSYVQIILLCYVCFLVINLELLVISLDVIIHTLGCITVLDDLFCTYTYITFSVSIT